MTVNTRLRFLLPRTLLRRALKGIFSLQKRKKKRNLIACAASSAHSAIFISDRLGLYPAWKKKCWNYFTSIKKKKPPKGWCYQAGEGTSDLRLVGQMSLGRATVEKCRELWTDQQKRSHTAEARYWHSPLWRTSGTWVAPTGWLENWHSYSREGEMADLRWRLIHFPYWNLHPDDVSTGKVNRQMMFLQEK